MISRITFCSRTVVELILNIEMSMAVKASDAVKESFLLRVLEAITIHLSHLAICHYGQSSSLFNKKNAQLFLLLISFLAAL